MAPSVRSSANLAAIRAVGLLLMASALVSAVPDSNLCPFELGYNPTFNADGSGLFCTKGTESFQVDDAGILALSLRGIGNSAQALFSGLIAGDFSVFNRFVQADAVVELLDGPHPASDTGAILAFVNEALVFSPGVDTTAVAQISDYHFLDNAQPRFASVHLTIFSGTYIIDVDSFWRFNLVDGKRVWQLQKTTNQKLVPN